ncbi:MAGa3780 family membrane protein [Mycoplasmopsis lipofaciens]|uniref:MAGa3780 family membrane protein n=1 Tax=Mycoplasmopsis lipofaciens TaxID=114884 RepID=UPI000483EEDA|nr:hypothetical protein [Mycoplasmopsis lipofaciens]
MNKKSIFIFDKTQKLKSTTFLAGITIILCLNIVFISNFSLIATNIKNLLANLSIAEKQWLINNNLQPKVIPSFWESTITFTYISNFLSGLSLIFFSLNTKKEFNQKFLFCSTIYITITFIVFWSLIFPQIFLNNGYNPKHFVLSTIVHFLNPLIAIVFAILNRKNIFINKKTIYIASFFVIIYFCLAMIMYFSGLKITDEFIKDNIKNSKYDIYINTKIVIYGFLNFQKPLFYGGGNIFIVILLDMFMFLLAFILPVGIGYFWKFVLKIKNVSTINEVIN